MILVLLARLKCDKSQSCLRYSSMASSLGLGLVFRYRLRSSVVLKNVRELEDPILKFFLGGTPFLAPESAAFPKMITPVLPMTPHFYCRILFHSKNVDVCKKLELNPLRFDRDIRVFEFEEKKISKIFICSLSEQNPPVK